MKKTHIVVTSVLVVLLGKNNLHTSRCPKAIPKFRINPVKRFEIVSQWKGDNRRVFRLSELGNILQSKLYIGNTT